MQRKQYLVKLSNESEGNKFIKYLENEGLINVHNISFEHSLTKVLAIDNEKFFAVSVTCLAGLAGKKTPISIEEYVAIRKHELVLTNSI